MTLRDAFDVAVRGLLANRLRSVLTMLGIVIGVAAVILLVALGNGTSARLSARIQALGTDLVSVYQSRDSLGASGRVRPLTERDIDALERSVPPSLVASITPVVQLDAVLESANGDHRFNVVGTSASYASAYNRRLAAGSFFELSDSRAADRVVVLGDVPARQLFDGQGRAAIGQRVRIGSQYFEVVGVLEPNGVQDSLVVVPINAFRRYLVGGTDTVDQIVVRASDRSSVPAVVSTVTDTLLASHRINRSQQDFSIRSNLDLLKRYGESTRDFTLFLGAIAAISLLVGGIGIMNVMLITINERKQEIGIRLAVGADKYAIFRQFLVESTLLAGIGGVLGVGVGVGASLLGAALGAQPGPDAPVLRGGPGDLAPPELSIGAAVLAFGVSLVIGVVFGVYPAVRAGRMRPIDALRHE